jgi:hypothetical protein
VHGLGRPGEAAVVGHRNDKLDVPRVHAGMYQPEQCISSSLTQTH